MSASAARSAMVLGLVICGACTQSTPKAQSDWRMAMDDVNGVAHENMGSISGKELIRRAGPPDRVVRVKELQELFCGPEAAEMGESIYTNASWLVARDNRDLYPAQAHRTAIDALEVLVYAESERFSRPAKEGDVNSLAWSVWLYVIRDGKCITVLRRTYEPSQRLRDRNSPAAASQGSE